MTVSTTTIVAITEETINQPAPVVESGKVTGLEPKRALPDLKARKSVRWYEGYRAGYFC